MKHYTVAEVAKKLRVSDNAVYDRVKSGEIKKAPNMGRTVRIPATELKKFNAGWSERNYFTYDEDKVEVIETHLGKIRKVKGEDGYVVRDLVELLDLKDSYPIVRRIGEKLLRKLDVVEANELGLYCTQRGLLLITYKGIETYLEKSRNPNGLDFKTLLKELKVKEEVKEVMEEVKETCNSNIQVFNSIEFGQVRTLMINKEPWFVGKDIAETLGYVKARNAIAVHVDYEDKKGAPIQGELGGKQVMTVINESGLYSLMLSSKLPQAKKFKRWVTNEVLPTIRQTGGYVNNSVKFVDNYFGTLSKDTREIILAELENKNNALMLERAKIDKKVLENVDVIEKIQETFKKEICC